MNTIRKERQPTIKLSLNMPAELRKRLRLYCALHDRTMSSVILATIESYLKQQERNEPSNESIERWRRER